MVDMGLKISSFNLILVSNVSNGTRSVLFNPRHLEGMIFFTMIFPFSASFIGVQVGSFHSIPCFLEEIMLSTHAPSVF